ncbi:MAG: hypothetical protein LW626_12735 [Verrucomicrobium sp.]|nr:hypothetical protein [Verrucomicrobium sp.]
MRNPAAESAMTWCDTPCWASSQAVSEAPWQRGRVSSQYTWNFRPAAWAA